MTTRLFLIASLTLSSFFLGQLRVSGDILAYAPNASNKLVAQMSLSQSNPARAFDASWKPGQIERLEQSVRQLFEQTDQSAPTEFVEGYFLRRLETNRVSSSTTPPWAVLQDLPELSTDALIDLDYLEADFPQADPAEQDDPRISFLSTGTLGEFDGRFFADSRQKTDSTSAARPKTGSSRERPSVTTPEPASLALFGPALATLLWLRRRIRR